MYFRTILLIIVGAIPRHALYTALIEAIRRPHAEEGESRAAVL